MADAIKIGVWGGPGSGKTTFLAALRIAILKYARNTNTSWTINGIDEKHAGSALFLETNTRYLQRGEFPPATTGKPTDATYTYEVNGTLLASWPRRSKDVQFTLNVFDYPGGDLLDKDAGDELWEYLTDCQGLIYLFDPNQTEVGKGNFDYLQRALDMMRRVFVRKSLAINRGRLPQHLAFCITKFDEPLILERLLDRNLIAFDGSDPTYPPFVMKPFQAFECLADDLTIQVVRGYFHEDRLSYFGTSSIGFYADPTTGRVDITDCSNMQVEREEFVDSEGRRKERERFRIKGTVNPIGVFEPLRWLYHSLSTRRSG